METKRDEDARRIRDLESRLAEAENFVSIRPKLQGARFPQINLKESLVLTIS